MKKAFFTILMLGVFVTLAFGVSNFSKGERIHQSKMGTVAATGDVIFVDSSTGNNGFRGEIQRHAVQTLARALAIAQAGDTIILNPGGSETVTATIAANIAQVKIICSVRNPYAGYTITGAGTLNLMTVSAADVEISGVTFEHTGATSNQAGITATLAADRLKVSNCLFNDSAIVTTFTGIGIEIVDSCDDVSITDCVFRDCRFGVQTNITALADQVGLVIVDSKFYVGQATAFGIDFTAGNGTQTLCVIDSCTFIEADGDGTAATDAWDGSDGTNAASGPIKAGADSDQYLVTNCVAYTALSVDFVLINAISASADGSVVDSYTGSGSALETKIDTIDANVDTILTNTDSIEDQLSGSIGVGVFPTAAVAANNVSLAEVIRYIQEDGTDILKRELSGAIGVGVFPTAAAAANNVSIAEVLRYVQENLSNVNTSIGEADVDISEAVYTGYITLMTITPAAGQSIRALSIELDYNKASTGYDNVATAADVMDIAIVSKVDDTNFRQSMNGTQITANGNGSLEASEDGERFNVGVVSIGGEVRVMIKVDVERDDFEVPYRVTWVGGATSLTITAVAIP